MRTPAIVFLAVFVAIPAFALVNDYNITVATPADVTTRRQQLITYIWGTAGFPASELPSDSITIPSPISGLGTAQNFQEVELLKINETDEHKGRALHFIPIRKNGQVVVVHHGHGTTFEGSADLPDTDAASFGLRRTIAALLMDGYGVLAVYMPHTWQEHVMGEGQPSDPAQTATYPPSCSGCGCVNHDAMFLCNPPSGFSALKWFLEPTIVALNHVQGDYTDFHMVGLSGGGWATTVVAAIDPRIRMSFSVAGTMPLYLRAGPSSGDTEQIDPGFYTIAGYPDLYVLGSYGAGRKQVQILNRGDDCCFGASTNMHNQGSEAGWYTAVRDYEKRVRLALFGLGPTPANGSFRVEVDEAPVQHLVSWNAVIGTILAELNHGRRYTGASSLNNVYVRGGDTHLYRRNGTVWQQAPFTIVGVASGLENATAPLDVFYRDNANKLMWATWSSGGGWAASVPLALPPDFSIMSDPVAVTTGPGRFDVVATGRDYKLYHWSHIAGVTTRREVTGSAYVRGMLSMVAMPLGRLDVFYRGDARSVYNARWNGLSWTTTFVGDQIQDFPSAVAAPDGSLRVYSRGLSGQLWEAVQTSGGSGWTWSSVSATIPGVPLIAGTPAASVDGGVVKVHARNAAGNVVVFTRSGSWSYSNLGGGTTGSPTVVAPTVLVRGNSGGLWTYSGTWVSLGGYFD